MPILTPQAVQSSDKSALIATTSDRGCRKQKLLQQQTVLAGRLIALIVELPIHLFPDLPVARLCDICQPSDSKLSLDYLKPQSRWGKATKHEIYCRSSPQNFTEFGFQPSIFRDAETS
jgi:hypothetical protein